MINIVCLVALVAMFLALRHQNRQQQQEAANAA
jgi:Tfp pilus assembly protein PilW